MCALRDGHGHWQAAGVKAGGWILAGVRLTLQDLEILNVCPFRVDVKLDSGHGNVHEDAVEDLAEGRAGMAEQLDAGLVSSRERGKGEGGGGAYPVPHCSTLVMLSWSRLLSHCTSSCLQEGHESARPDDGRVRRRAMPDEPGFAHGVYAIGFLLKRLLMRNKPVCDGKQGDCPERRAVDARVRCRRGRGESRSGRQKQSVKAAEFWRWEVSKFACSPFPATKVFAAGQVAAVVGRPINRGGVASATTPSLTAPRRCPTKYTVLSLSKDWPFFLCPGFRQQPSTCIWPCT